tara:strand:+ start:5647 stop:6267 length:621 start_codon:yes stop_codon:yes gene_type:complete
MAIAINGTGTVTGLSVGGVNDGAIAHADLADSTKPMYVSYARLEDRKSQNTGGGSNTGGTSELRDLNTEALDPDGIIIGFNNNATSGNLKANGTNYTVQPGAKYWTLGAGTYVIRWSAPMYHTGRHKTFVYDETNSSFVAYGTAEYAYYSTTRSTGSGRVTLTGNTTFSLNHRGETGISSNGFGVESNFGSQHETYSVVEIYKEAS